MLFVPAENEAARLRVMLDYKILDTPPEARFDDLVYLAKDVCGTPISLITFLDPDRQWFKARYGLSICETSRDVAFCAHAVRQPDIFIVSDTFQDPRFAQNPLVVSEPYIRFYAGVPLVSPVGVALGSICVIDRVPRQLSPNQIESLKALGRQVVQLLEFRKLNLNLEVMVQMRTEDLEKSTESLAIALQARDRFLSVASHELKEPLSSLKLRLQFMERKLRDGRNQDASTAQLATDMVQIDRDIQDIADTIENLLDVSRIKSRNMILQREEILLAGLVEKVLGKYDREMADRGISARLNLDRKVLGKWDRESLERAFGQLVSNAIKHGNGRPIEVSVRSSLNMAISEVRDYGNGISNAEQAVMFSRLEHADPTRDVKGLGLGLYIMSQLVAANGGQVAVESEVGNGSLFRIQLPLAEK